MSSKRYLTYSNITVTIALVTSVFALIVSIYEATIMQSQQKAMVWPHVNIRQQHNSQGFGFVARNNGIGPALISSMEVRLNGSAVENFNDLLDVINPDRTFGYNILKMENFNGTVLATGEERLLFGIPYNDETWPITQKLYDTEMIVEYESVLGEKWNYNLKTKKTVKEKFKAEVEFQN